MIECIICKKEITPKDKILAFDEVDPDDLDWDYASEFREFDEIIPKSNGWFLAHFYCIFKKSSSDDNVYKDD